jgi:uncharacterized protein Yka (UPF0111/DUF47 family)
MPSKILDLLLPRETAFFKYFNEQIDLFCSACETFKKLASEIGTLSPSQIHQYATAVKHYESKEDELEMVILNKLNDTFITPIDREDIHHLVVSIGNSMDIVNDVTQKIEKYQVKQVPQTMLRFVEIIITMSEEVKGLINSLQKKKNLMPYIERVHILENEADALIHTTMAELFQTNDPIYIIKFKDMYEHLEEVINSMDDIAKLIRGITVKWV